MSQIENCLVRSKKIILISSPDSNNGLSIIAHMLSERFISNFNNFVYCLNANENTIEYSFKQFANKIPNFVIEEKSDQEQLILRVYNHLNNKDKKTKILFVFNDCENYENIQSYIKPNENIFFLITTKNRFFISRKNKSLFEKFDLNPFSQNECKDYLKNNEIEIKLKTNTIQPYVLNKMIAFVKLKRLHGMELNHNDFIDKTYTDEELFKILIENDNNAWNILKFSSILDSNFISISILERLTNIDKKNLTQIIQNIESISLINALYNDEFGFQISTSFQQDIISYMKDDNLPELENIRIKIASIINEIFDVWSTNKYYFNNIIKMISFLLNEKMTIDPEKYEIMKNFAQFYFRWENYDESLNLYKECLRMCNEDSSLETALILNKMGIIFEMKGDYNESLDNHYKSINIYETIGEIISVQYATALNNIANVFEKIGDYEKSLAYLKKSSDITEKIFGPICHPAIASSLNNIGCVYSAKQMNDLAIQSFNKALEITKRVNGDVDGLEVAGLYKSLANAFLNKQEYDSALENYEKCLKILKKLFKENHPKIADVLKEMASIYQKKFDDNRALELYEKSLLIYRRLYGNETSIADSLNSIAEIYQGQSDHDKALEYYNQSLQAYQDIYRNNNNDLEKIINIYIGMGNAYKSQGRYKKSLECYNNALSIACTCIFKNNELISSIHESIDCIKIYNGKHGNYRKIPSDIISGGSGAHVCLVEDINDTNKK